MPLCSHDNIDNDLQDARFRLTRNLTIGASCCLEFSKLKALNYRIYFFTHLKLCLTTAAPNFKCAKATHITIYNIGIKADVNL